MSFQETPTPLTELVQAAFLGDDTPAATAAIAELAERADELPVRLRQALEQIGVLAQGEARLAYASKWPTAQVLDIAPVPLQPVTAFGDVDDVEWHNRLVFGDNLGVLAALVRMKQRGELKNADGTDGVRVCYIDPPFATEREFSNSSGQVAYKDKVAGAEFVEFLRRRLILIRELLADDGTLYVHLDTKKAHYIKVALDEVFGESCFQGEIVWKRTSAKNFPGQRQPGRVHDSLLMFSRGPRWLWNTQYIEYDQTYIDDFYKHNDDDGRGRYQGGDLTAVGHSPERKKAWRGASPPAGRVWMYSEEVLDQMFAAGKIIHKPGTKPRLKRFLSEQPGVQIQDVWTDVGPVSRPLYPTEKPQALLDRVIKASSNAGDIVLDCFMGSGSTLRAAERLGRRWIGVDAGKLAIHTATRELVKLADDPDVDLQPFALYHAGLYDPDRLEQLDHGSWTSFVLDLYNAQHKTDTRHGIAFHGRLGSGTTPTLVHVLDPGSDTPADGRRVIDRTWLESFARAVKAGPRTSLAVICPTDAAPSLRDSDYDIDWHDGTRARTTRVRVLKVPPAITNEFLAISQPGNKDEINALIESHGFDIAQPPIVDINAKIVGGKPVVDIVRFESNAIVRDRKGHIPQAPTDPREDLAMALVDHHYDQDRFDFEKHIFGDTLAKAKRKFRIELDKNALTSDTGLILIDRFGNEARLVVKAEDFTS